MGGRLIAEGPMYAAGLAEVTPAKTDGRLEAAYAGQAKHRGAGQPRRGVGC